jgi:hypothetical protein
VLANMEDPDCYANCLDIANTFNKDETRDFVGHQWEWNVFIRYLLLSDS